jgi:UDP-N-acetylmuramoylalanine--D-glutamate ligase
MDLQNKKVLLVGLGILGGGLSVAQHLIKRGAILTITDLRSKEELSSTIKKLPTNIRYTLGQHKKSDFEKAELVLFNQAVPVTSEWVKLAKKMGKYYSDYGFFIENLKSINPNALIIGITGTRGKSTISTWTEHLIPGSVLSGNIPEKNFLKQVAKKTDVFVLELSSYQLEHFTSKTKAPNIAVLTNVYVDHLNRYGTFKKYKEVKFKIFKNQTKNDVLVLNADEKITKEILAEKPTSQIFFISQKTLPKSKNGLFFDGEKIYYQYLGQKTLATTVKGLAKHEKSNLLTAMLVAHLVGTDGLEINKLIKDLPNPAFRQQVIFENKDYKIINDSAGTSPDATIAAIEKFKAYKNFVLISGGTNKELNFSELARKIKKDIKPENLFLLEGSGTDLLIKELQKINFIPKNFIAYENLEYIIDIISQEFPKATIVFSPACASFEKFKNEFDRGQKFNKLVKKYFS